MARVHFVKKARKDVPNSDIKAGDSYYWWKFRFGGKHVSKTPPRRSQLTQSAYLSQLYDLQDRIGEASVDESLRDLKDDVISTLEEMRDECQSNLDNMPDNLRDNSSSGELLQERVDALENAISEFENIDVDSEPTEDDIEHEDGEPENHDKLDEAVEAYWQGVYDEMTGIDIG